MRLGRRALLRTTGLAVTGLSAAASAGVSGRENERPAARATADYGPLASLDVPGAAEAVVDAAGETAYVAVGDGFVSVDLTGTTPTIAAERRTVAADREDGPLGSVLDVALSGDRLLVSGPAQGGRLKGLAVFDVSDSAAPRRATAFAETGFGIHNADLDGDYAYLTNNAVPDRPLTVYDASGANGERTPEEVARWSPLEVDVGVEGWSELPEFPGVLHDVTVQDDVAYCAYWDGGVWMVDVSDPTDPSYLGRTGHYSLSELVALAENPEDFVRAYREGPGNAHYAGASDDGSVLAVGGEAWDDPDTEGGGPVGITLYDVTDPAAPRELATIEPEAATDTSRSGTWVTAHNFELRGDRLYSAWYDAGVKVHDISDPTRPELLSWWLQPEEARFWTAQVAVPGESFVASSYGVDDHRSALYVFPDDPGQQADRPVLTDPETTATATATQTPTATATRTQTPTATPTTEENERLPGFGPLAAAAGLSYGAYRYLRRDDGEE